MPLSVNSNTSALLALLGTSKAVKEANEAMEKLSTGKRINSAKDDAAGVAISSRLDISVRGLKQSTRNALDAQALLNTAEGGMKETEAVLQRLRELSVQAANDTNSTSDRKHLDDEAKQLLAEIDRIANSTTWAGQKLLDGSFTNKVFQIGAGSKTSDQLVTSILGITSSDLGLGEITVEPQSDSTNQSQSDGTNQSQSEKTVITYGVDDSFATTNGIETSNVSAGLQSYLTSTFPTTPVVNFDDSQTNSLKATSFDLSLISGEITGATLKLRAIPLDDNRGEGNDKIFLSGFDASGNNIMPSYNIGLGVDAGPNNYFDFDWQIDGRPAHPDEGYEISIDLSNFSAQEGTELSLLDNIKAQKLLDIVLPPDTMVDYVSLEVTSTSSNTTSEIAPQKVGTEFQINTYTTGDQSNPSLTTLSDGKFVIAWDSEGQDGSSFGVYAQVYNPDGTKHGSEFALHTSTRDSQTVPVLTALKNGGFVAAWRDRTHDGDWFGIFAQVFDNVGDKVATQFQVSTSTYGNQINPSITTLLDGNVIITWMDSTRDGDEYGMFGQMISSEGGKIGSEFQINTYITDQQKSGKVTPLRSGGFAVAWASVGQDGDDSGIYFQLFDQSGARVGTEIKANTTTAGRQDVPDIAALENGGFVVTWWADDQDGSGRGVYAQIFDESSAPVGSEFLVNTVTEFDEYSPAITSLSDGGFLIVWEGTGDHGGDGHDLFAQKFKEDGTRVGSEFQVNLYDENSANNGDQTNPAVIELEGGRLLFAWNSSLNDGDGEGVFAQIFNTSESEVDDLENETGANDLINVSDVVDLSNASDARASIMIIDEALATLNHYRSNLGAISNRLDHVVANNTNIAINLTASMGRIQDADYAAESTRLVKSQLIQQSSVAMIAQANTSKEDVLQLIEGD